MAEEKNVSKDRCKWFREMRSELKNVVWPDGKTTAKYTGTVLLCSLIVGAAIWICLLYTSAIARAHGAVVYERFNHVNVGKGYALDFLLQHIGADYPERCV